MKRHENEAFIVKMKDKSYADLLKAVKNTINPSDIGADIKEVRKMESYFLLYKADREMLKY